MVAKAALRCHLSSSWAHQSVNTLTVEWDFMRVDVSWRALEAGLFVRAGAVGLENRGLFKLT